MRSDGVNPKLVTYNMLIFGHVKLGNRKTMKANKLFLQNCHVSIVHWSLPSGHGMFCGNRRGNSNSPSDAKGECRCRFSGWMLMLSCLATSETISSFVTGVRSSFPVEMNLLNTKSALSSRFAAVWYCFILSSCSRASSSFSVTCFTATSSSR